MHETVIPDDEGRLPAAVEQVMEVLLKPKREAFSQKRRHAQYQEQGGRCALCDAELRTGEDEGDHVQPLHSTVAGQPQTGPNVPLALRLMSPGHQ